MGLPFTMNFFPTGIIGPLQPKSSRITSVLLVITAAVFSITSGYDSGLMTGLNIMPAYSEFLRLTTATRGLNVSANFIGWGIAALTMGPVVNFTGRKNAILVSLLGKVFSAGIISGAHNFPMFVSGRILLGTAKGLSTVAGSAWLAETLPPKIRGLGLATTYSAYYIGALVASGVTYRTAQMDGNWSWRLPCLLQILPSLASAICLFLTPESPRWLVYNDRNEDALTVVASVESDGNRSETNTISHYQDIVASRDWERNEGHVVAVADLFKTRPSRRRVLLAISVAIIVMGSGNNIASYFLGDMLSNAGISSKNTQLKLNVVLNSWCLVCAAIGTYSMDRFGRKTLALFGCTGMTILMIIIGTLTKEYSHSTNTAGIYATVAGIFIFMGFYGVGVTPITTLYPAEVLSYPLRANGMALWAGFIATFAIMTTLLFPIALAKISWKLYFIIAAWDFLETVFVYFCWIETKGLALEEIDRIFEGISQVSSFGPKALEGNNTEEGQDIVQTKDETQTQVRNTEIVKTSSF